MRSELIEGMQRSELDAQIAQFISKHPNAAPPHMNMRVAIRNEAGELYRLIIADGIVELIRVDKFLVGIGCIEESADEFDALFRVALNGEKSLPTRGASSEGSEPQRHE